MGTFLSISKNFELRLFGTKPKLTPDFFRVQRVCQYLYTWLFHYNLLFVDDQKWILNNVNNGRKMAALTIFWFMLICESYFFWTPKPCSVIFLLPKLFFYSEYESTSWKRPCMFPYGNVGMIKVDTVCFRYYTFSPKESFHISLTLPSNPYMYVCGMYVCSPLVHLVRPAHAHSGDVLRSRLVHVPSAQSVYLHHGNSRGGVDVTPELFGGGGEGLKCQGEKNPNFETAQTVSVSKLFLFFFKQLTAGGVLEISRLKNPNFETVQYSYCFF